jgi:hypothetical protein
MKFGELLEQAARSDWAVHYVNYKRGKDQITAAVDVKTFKSFIQVLGPDARPALGDVVGFMSAVQVRI